MGHQELKRRCKYELVIFFYEKPRFTFANFLHLFIQGPPLTHSALFDQIDTLVPSALKANKFSGPPAFGPPNLLWSPAHVRRLRKL